MNLEQAFGLVLKKHRKQHDLSQEEMASVCELDRTYISLLERGKRRPTLNTIFTISRSLQTNASDLIRDVEVLLDPAAQESRD